MQVTLHKVRLIKYAFLGSHGCTGLTLGLLYYFKTFPLGALTLMRYDHSTSQYDTLALKVSDRHANCRLPTGKWW